MSRKKVFTQKQAFRMHDEHVIIPDGYTEIAFCGFIFCDHIKSLIILEGIKIIRGQAFFFCAQLTNVELPNSLELIEYSAFENCERLLEIKIPCNVIKIENDAFSGCESLKRVNIPRNLIDIGEKQFRSCPDLEFIQVDEDNPAFSGIDGVLFNKDRTTLIKYPNASSGTKYTVPDTVTVIKEGAFECCRNLTEVIIPCSVTSIDVFAFNNSTVLKAFAVDKNNPSYTDEDGVLFDKNKTILIKHPGNTTAKTYTVPDTVEHIEDGAFFLSELAGIKLPNSLKSIGAGAFQSCDKLTEIEFPPNLKSIGKKAFYWSHLKNINIPDSVTDIEDKAFSCCEKLETVRLSKNLTKIQSETFEQCSSLSELVIPDGVQSIESLAFVRCQGVKEITIPKSVLSIAEDAFEVNTALTAIHVSKDNPNYTDVDGVLYSKDKTGMIKCPGAYAKETMVIPHGVRTISDTVIGTRSVRNSDLYYPGYVVLPSTIENISVSKMTYHVCK
ncbi:MAG: leucine-rich repeat domain-containing protein [Oscillospiraceae bacterium]|nr:leucine-rich repeat domain-containing protein [Oscillospiraceae bacterium]